MSTLEFRVAIRDAIAEELERDDRVIFMGEDVAAAGGVFKATPGLLERFGPERVIDTPISELALAGAAFGAAATGLRPIFEIMFGDFMALPMDSLVNQAAKYWYISNEQAPIPLVVRSAVGGGGRFGAVHSQIHAHLVPGHPRPEDRHAVDARARPRGCSRARSATTTPSSSWSTSACTRSRRRSSSRSRRSRSGVARVARAGRDLTIVSVGKGLRDALAAADELASDGIEAEVVDLRTLRPLDLETVLASVAKTNRMLAVEEGPRTGGWATGLLGAVAEAALHDLDDAWIVATGETPVPYSPTLEDAFIPNAGGIAAGVRAPARSHNRFLNRPEACTTLPPRIVRSDESCLILSSGTLR